MHRHLSLLRTTTSAALLATTFLACGGGGEDSSEAFVVRTSDFAAGATTPFAADGYQFAFLANEATSGAQDLNNDGDTLDDVAVFVDARTRVEKSTGIAARAVALLGDEPYLVAVEAADGVDWNKDGDELDSVLVRWDGLPRVATDIATLPAGSGDPVVSGNRLWFVGAATAPLTVSGLHYIEELSPKAAIAVGLAPNLPAATQPILAGAKSGCVHVSLSEVSEAVDLNNDLDALDTSVLALVDAGEDTPLLRNSLCAMPSAAAPVAVRADSAGIVEVAFLVSEADQGATNFNVSSAAGLGSAWQEDQCATSTDADTLDAVVHYLRWSSFVDSAEAARNTGLPGDAVVVLVDGYVATDCDEAAHGGCDLNGDADATDTIARWTQIVAPATAMDPHSTEANMHPVRAVPGGTHGIVAFDGRLVIAYDEASDGEPDIDGNGSDNDALVAWLDPTPTGGEFTFLHGVGANAEVGVSWMALSPGAERLCVALTEAVAGEVINDLPEQEGSAGDRLDSIPTFAYFSGSSLIFPGVAIAVRATDAGITTARGSGFYRVDEAADSFDWNGDGDQTDVVVRQTNLSLGSSLGLGTGSAVAGATAANYGGSPNGPSVAMFLTDEAMAGVDLNNDGDQADKIVRWFRFD